MLGLRLGWRQRGSLPIRKLRFTQSQPLLWGLGGEPEGSKWNPSGTERGRLSLDSGLQLREGSFLPKALEILLKLAPATSSSTCWSLPSAI